MTGDSLILPGHSAGTAGGAEYRRAMLSVLAALDEIPRPVRQIAERSGVALHRANTILYMLGSAAVERSYTKGKTDLGRVTLWRRKAG